MATVVEKFVIEGETSGAQTSVRQLEQSVNRSFRKIGQSSQRLATSTNQLSQSFTKTTSGTAAFGMSAQRTSGAVDKLSSSTDQLTRSINQQAKASRSAASAKESLRASIASTATRALASIAIFAELVRQIRAGTQAALERERTTITRDAALRSSNQLTRENINLLEAQASALERSTGESDEIQRSLQAQAIAMGVAVDEVNNFITAAFALQNATGGRLSANSALQQLIKSTSGLKGELGEAIPFIREMSEEQLRAGEAITEVNRRLGDLAGVGAEGGQGAIRRTSNEFQNLREDIAAATLASQTFKNIVNALGDEFESTGAAVRAGAGVFEIFFGATEGGLRQILEAERRIAELDAQAAEIEKRIAQQRREAATIDFGADAPAIPLTFGAPQVDFGQFGADGLEGATAFGPGGEGIFGTDAEKESIEERNRIAASNLRQRLEVEQRFATGLRELRERNAIAIADIEIREAERSEKERIASEQRTQDTINSLVRQGVSITQSFVQQGIQQAFQANERIEMLTQELKQATAVGDEQRAAALREQIKASEFAFGAFAKQFLRSTGTQMIASGVQNLLTAAAYAVIPGFQPLAVPLATVGGVQVATGSAFLAGQLAIPAQARGSAGGSRGGALSTGGGGGAIGGGSTGTGAGTGGTRELTVIFNGPTTKAEVGVAIREALAEADTVGV